MWTHSSYVAVRDGTRLALRLYGPDDSGAPLPVVWMHYRYNRPVEGRHLDRWLARYPQLSHAAETAASAVGDRWSDIVKAVPWIPKLVESGYYAAVVDVRGTGASFGHWRGPFSPEEQRDAFDVTEWLAEQPWCDGNVGMFGRSYMGANQYLAAVGRPPHLKTIFPEMAPFDLYALLHDNGIFREDFAHTWSSDVRRRDVSDSASLIDSDPTGAIVAEARAEHASDRDAFLIFRDARFRDSIDPDSGDALYEIFNVGPRWSAEVIPVYHLAGWYDLRPGDAFLYLLNAGGPFHLVLGPWSHTGTAGFDLAQEHINWYDACLKHRGEAPAGQKITYAVMSSEGSVQWRAGTRCEFERVSRVELSLKADRWTIHSNGRHECSTESAIMITYRVDPNASSGIASRWSNGYGGPFGYGDMRSNDRRALTFTSPPLAAPLELRGFPCIRLSLEAHDALNIFVFLEDVHPDGWSQYLTEGALALAHRTLGGAPYEVPEIPFYPGRASDIQPPLSAPARVEIPLFPIAFCFPTGHRLRVAITGADRDNAEEVVTTRHSRFVFDFRTEHNVLVLPCGNSDGPSFCYGESP